jgi:hypothetical protein
VMPEVGAYAWICKQSTGRNAPLFILGFKAPFDENNVNYRCNRQNLNPGDIMMRTRDENFVILRRGGVLQIGSTPTCQTMYIPIQNIMKHFCENFEINAFGGELKWLVDRDDQTTDGTAPVKLALRVKEKANDKLHIANISIGSHGEGDKTTMLMEVFDSGVDGQKPMVSLSITKEGTVGWTVEKDYSIIAKENVQITSLEKDITVQALKGNIVKEAAKNVTITAKTGTATLDGKTLVLVKSATQADVDAPMINLGAGATSQGVKGTELQAWLTQLVSQIAAFTYIAPLAPAPGPPVPVIAAPAIASLTASMSTWLSPVVKTK